MLLQKPCDKPHCLWPFACPPSVSHFLRYSCRPLLLGRFWCSCSISYLIIKVLNCTSCLLTFHLSFPPVLTAGESERKSYSTLWCSRSSMTPKTIRPKEKFHPNSPATTFPLVSLIHAQSWWHTITVLQENSDGEGADFAFHACCELWVYCTNDAQGLHHQVEDLWAELGC